MGLHEYFEPLFSVQVLFLQNMIPADMKMQYSILSSPPFLQGFAVVALMRQVIAIGWIQADAPSSQ
jgi:hypothetical protein